LATALTRTVRNVSINLTCTWSRAHVHVGYCDEASRIYGVLEARLENRDFVAGHGRGKYTIADMKMLPWIREHKDVGIDLKDFPNIQRCAEQCMSREGTKTGLRVGLDEVK
jgi:glutathione S-transferase